MKLKLNILAPFIIAFVLWVGITGRVSWWTVALVVLSHAELNVVFRR